MRAEEIHRKKLKELGYKDEAIEEIVSKYIANCTYEFAESYHAELLNLHIVSNRTCCVCKEKVISKIEADHIHPLRQEQGMWADGVVEKITFGYGSKHDMDSYYIAICDNCITELKESGLATDLKELKKKCGSYG